MSVKKRSKLNRFAAWWKSRGRAQKVGLVLLSIFIINNVLLFAAAQWYIAKHRNEPMNWGITFIPRYARYFELDPKETLSAMINDLGVKRYRLVSYWNDIEKEPGNFNFEELDWQFDMIEKAGGEVSLAIGLRQPRWPECHMPDWAEYMTVQKWTAELKEFMAKVIERYKNRPALKEYQLENEFFMTVFGICPDHSRERLVEEYNFVKALDPNHPVIVSRSNNWVGLPLGAPRPDKFAISVYKRVWDKTFTKRYFEYPLPAWFYAGLAGQAELLTGKDMIIHELQAEPWLPPGFEMNDVNDIAEQNKSMNAERLKGRIAYAKGTGMRTVDLWGAEWWYWRKVKAGDPSIWEAAKAEIAKPR